MRQGVAGRRLYVGLLLGAFIGALTLGAAGLARAGEDPAAANRLLVEAVKLVEEAEATEAPAGRARLYKRALDTLDRIVERHPGSGLAVRLVTGQPIGALDRAAVERQWRFALAEECIVRREGVCLLWQALEFAKMVTSPRDRDIDIAEIADFMAQERRFSEALRIAALVDRPGAKAYALGRIARAQAAADDEPAARRTLESAVELVGHAHSALERGFALGAIAGARFRIGEIEASRETIGRARSAAVASAGVYDRVWALLNIATSQILVGDFDGVKATTDIVLGQARLLVQPHVQVWAIGGAAAAQAKAGDVFAASETLGRAKRLLRNSSLVGDVQMNLWGIAEAEVALGNSVVAHRVAGGLSDPQSRLFVLAHIAYAEHRIGETDRAYRSAVETLEVLRQAEDPDLITISLAILASVL